MGLIRINIDNREIIADDSKNLLQTALENNIEIPHLCYDERIKPYGACGLCVVEVEGSIKLLRACSTMPFDGMVVKTDTKRLRDTRRSALKLLTSDHRGDCRPPCMLACPAKTDCQGYVGLIANGEYKEALKVVKDKLPLPASIGRICPHPCETACRRQLVEEPVSIAALKSFIADMDLEGDTYMPETKPSSGKKVAVIGAGPAGLSCAYYLAKEGHRVDMYESMPKPGGMLRYGIPQYRLPKEILDKEIDIITRIGVNINCNVKVGRDITLQYLRNKYDSVFLGIGAWKSTKLNCTGEDCEGVFGGIDFLIEVASNANVFIGKRVLVVGGGNTAMDVCRTAVRLGAEDVRVLYRRTREEMPAEAVEINEAEEEGVKFEFLVAPTEVITRDGRAAGLECQRMMLGEPDSSGRRKPVPIPGEKVVFEADMIISAIGQRIDIGGISGISTSKSGSIVIDEETFMTSMDGVFAGGDAVTGPNIAIAAIGHGKTCADLINSYLQGVVKIAEEPFYVKQNDMTEMDFKDRKKASRIRTNTLDPEIRKHNFAEINRTFTEEEARKESARCLECGCGDYFECQLYKYINEYGADPDEYKGERPKHEIADEHPFITRNQDKCILCGLCIRVCDEVMGVTALGLVKRGFDASVKPEFELPLNESSCISCGQCTNVCPTGACMEITAASKNVPVEYDSFEGICRYCSTGCRVRYDLKGNTVFRAVPINSEEGLLCERGKFGLKHINSPDRVYKNVVKAVNETAGDEEASLHFVKKLQSLSALYGRNSIAFAVSPRFSNEELFLIKNIAEGFNTNITGSFTNFERFDLTDITGFNGSTNSYDELYSTDLILSLGAVAENHPVLAVKMKRAAERKAKLVSINKDKTRMDEWADTSFKAENDLSFLYRFIKSLISLKYIDEKKASEKITNFEEFMKVVSNVLEDESSISLARLYGEAKKAVIVIDEDTLSPDAVELISLVSVLTGKIGMPHRGIIFAGRKSNSQGLLDMGFTSSGRDILEGIEGGKIKGLVVFGEDPLAALPQASEIFKGLDALITVDMLPTDTAMASDLFIALPCSEESIGSYTRADRKVQLVYEGINGIKGKSVFNTLLTIAKYLHLNIESIKDAAKLISSRIPGYTGLLSAFQSKDDFYTFGKHSLDASELNKLRAGISIRIPRDKAIFIDRVIFDSIERYWETYKV